MARGGAGEARKGPNRGRNGDRRPADNSTPKFGWAGNRRTSHRENPPSSVSVPLLPPLLWQLEQCKPQSDHL